jgi:hypothetical protein
MRIGSWHIPHLCLRHVIVTLTLVSHLMATFGFPLPASGLRKPTDGVPYPCQSRPCGCLSSEQCWSGDCCCFTLEEKLAWAEANGIEPPEHVYQLVKAPKSPAATLTAKPCCSEIEPVSAPSQKALRECCEVSEAAMSCCGEKWTPHDETRAGNSQSASDCPHCRSQTPTKCCEQKEAQGVGNTPRMRWVLGIFAQKCSGKLLGGLFQLDPALVSHLTAIAPPEVKPDGSIVPHSDQTISLTSQPPTPPPRFWLPLSLPRIVL